MFRGDRLRELRLENHISQTELAKSIGTSAQNIYKYEKGIVNKVPYETVMLLADKLNTTFGYLNGTSDQKYRISNESMKEEYNLSPLDYELLNKFAILNSTGKNKVLAFINEISFNPENLSFFNDSEAVHDLDK